MTSPAGAPHGRLTVNTDELRSAADEHDQRGQQWAHVAANPPNDPDQLAAAWGVIAHPTTEQLRATNASRAAAAQSIQQAHEQIAEKLRGSAHAYDNADATGQAGVETSFTGA